jgi:hypothetical protein
MTAPRDVRRSEPTILGTILFLVLLPIVWVVWWIGRAGEKLSAWKSKEDRGK